MGEAKAKRERLRAVMLDECEKWSFPPSVAEAQAVAEVGQLPSVTARRVPERDIAYMRMPGKECHANCAWYADNDPDKATRHVIGWWRQPGAFVLHSVVERAGQYFCITPQLPDTPETFEFIPDPAVEGRQEGEVRRFYRNGHPCHPGLRFDPPWTIRYMEAVKARLLAGVHPMRAGEVEVA
jgi:hypothetical protein